LIERRIFLSGEVLVTRRIGRKTQFLVPILQKDGFIPPLVPLVPFIAVLLWYSLGVISIEPPTNFDAIMMAPAVCSAISDLSTTIIVSALL
jgi:hypothetical protein